MRKKIDIQKTALAIATCAGAMVAHISSQAQDAKLAMNGQIAETTCLLSFAGNTVGAAGTGAYNMGMGSASFADANSTAVGSLFGFIIPITMKLTANDGSPCGLGARRWDIGINVSSTDYTTAANRTFLLSTANAATGTKVQNVGVLLKGGVVGGGVDSNWLNLANAHPLYGVLLSNGVSSMNLTSSDSIRLTAQFGRTSASTVVPGIFTATIPLTVWYN